MKEKKPNQNQQVAESSQRMSEKDEDEEDDVDEQRQHQIHVNQRRRRRYRNSFQNAKNLIQWEENTKSANFIIMKPGNNFWFKNIINDFENRDKKQVLVNMKTIIKLDNQDNNQLQQSKSKPNVIGWTNYNPQLQHGFHSQQDNYESMLNQNQELVSYKGQIPNQNLSNIRNSKKQQNGNMDLLKKFRYNFHYWLKNCYQPENQAAGEEDHNKEIYQTTQATNTAAGQISQMAKNGKLGSLDTKSPQITQRNSFGLQAACPNCQGTKDTVSDQKQRFCDKCLKNLPTAASGGGPSRQRSNAGQSAGEQKIDNSVGSKKDGSQGQAKPSKYMVIQMGQSEDELQDQMLIQFLSQNALAIKHHPGAVQFQVSKQMLSTLKKRFAHMRALLPNKKEGEGEAAESVAKQVIDSAGQPAAFGGSTNSQDTNQKGTRNSQFSHVLQPVGSVKAKQQRVVETSLDSKEGSGEQIRIKNFFRSPNLLNESRKLQESALNVSKDQSLLAHTHQSSQAGQNPVAFGAEGQETKQPVTQSHLTQQQSRYSSRSRLNSQSNKNSNMNSTFELKSQQQQFINKMSSHAGKSKASLERTLVASRDMLNRQIVQRPQGPQDQNTRTLQPQKRLQLQLSQKMQNSRVNEERGFQIAHTLNLQDQHAAQKRMQGALSNLTPASHPTGKVIAQQMPSPGLRPEARNLAQAQKNGIRYGTDRFDHLRNIQGLQRQNIVASTASQHNQDGPRLPHYEAQQSANSRNPQSPKHHLSPLESAEKSLIESHPPGFSPAKQGSHRVNAPSLGRMGNQQMYQRQKAVSVPEVTDHKAKAVVSPLLQSPLSSTAAKGKGSLYQGDVGGSRGYRSNLNHHAGVFGAQQHKGNQSPFNKKDVNKREFTSNMSLHNNSFNSVNHRIGQALGQVASEDERIFASMANGGF